MSEPLPPSMPRPPGASAWMPPGEQAYRMLVETSHDLIWSVDAEGRWTFVNAAARSIYGYEPGEMLGRPFMEFETPEQARKDLEVFALIKAGVPYFNYETVHLRKDGTPVHLSYNAVVHRDPEGRVLGTTGTARDITERTRAETTLREREHELWLITNHLPGPVSRVGPDRRFRFVNDHYERIFGRPREAIIGHTMEELLGAEHFQRIEPYLRRVQQGEAVTYESALCTPAGEVRHMLVNLVPERDSGGAAAGFYVIATDITERKRAEDALRDSESRARRLFDSGLQGAFITSTEGVIAQANDTFLRMVGYTRDDLTAGRLSWKKLTPPEFVERDNQAVQEIFSRGFCTPWEKEYIRKDGSRVPVLVGAALFDGSQGEGVAFALDLTERRRLEAQVREMQKMEAVGQLAGGVAHDFNNILTVVQGHLSLLDRHGDDLAIVHEAVREIREVTERAANLTRQLLAFSRRQALRPQPLDLHATVTNLARLLQRILGEDIRLELRLGPRELWVAADAAMLDQVLLNLVVNARDAMPQGGRLLIETSTLESDQAHCARMPQARRGHFACVTVSDSGPGIPADVLPRIFEPFFTTKEQGKGTGLGLATVYGIVQQHEGWIEVDSPAGRGATFRVYLPQLDQGRIAETPRVEKPGVPQGSETILIVEDERAVRALLTRLLAGFGYRVLEAASGRAAVAMWREHRAEIRLVLTDVVMPEGVSGLELAERLLRESPDLAVIFMSGYSPEIAGHEDKLIPGVNFLAKPFELDELARMIRAALDRNARSSG